MGNMQNGTLDLKDLVYLDLVEKEFALNNKPNLKVLNMTSIIKMFSTIFTNIDKKL